MIGILTFSKGMLCEREVLGKAYNARIGMLDVCITFPSLNYIDIKGPVGKVGISNPLLPPEKAKKIKRGDECLYWGCPMNYPKYDSVVNLALIEYECEDVDTYENAQVLYSNIGRWENAFNNYCFLCTKQYWIRENKNDLYDSKLELLSNGKYIGNHQSQRIIGHISSHDCFASTTIIMNAIEFASSGKDLLLEYEMLLSAYKAIKTNQNRQAIVDGSSAVELCLIKTIEKYCIGKSIDPDILLDKYRSLGDRFKLVEKIDNTFPKLDYKKLIVNPRNKVAHIREVKLSDETVMAFINAIEEVLKHYHTCYY